MTGLRRVRGWLARLAGLFGQGARDRDLAEELESHLQMHVDSLPTTFDELWKVFND